MTSSSIRGTRRFAGCPRLTSLPITPPIVPIVPVAPIVPVGPTPPTPRATPALAPVVPPVSPSEVQIAVGRFGLLARGVGYRRHRRTDSGQSLRDRIPIRSQRL